MSQDYVLTKRAQRDLNRIRDYIAGDSHRAAARFIASLIEEFDRLAAFPLMAQAVGTHPRFRRLPHGAYLFSTRSWRSGS